MKELSDCRVLIVDDVAANVDLLVEALRGEHKLTVARDGESALRLARSAAPDLVLLDIMMPGMDGYEVCRRLRADEATRELPIMFLSALEDAKDKARGFELGANDYLTKPFEPLEVRARVRSLLKAKAYADAVREAAEREMAIAKEIQTGILPSNLDSSLAGTGLEASAIMEPARHVGGDFYEVLRLDDDTIVVAVADVMGKGIPSSLFMVMSITLLRTLARQRLPPEEVLRRLNDELAANNPRRFFVTVSLLVIDLRTGRVIGASAGHNALVVVPAKGASRRAIAPSGPVAGIFRGKSYASQELQLEPGDLLVLSSDGVWEAESPTDGEFGDERLVACVAGCSGGSAADAVARLHATVREFEAGLPPRDDLTILALRYDPALRTPQTVRAGA